MKIEEHIKFKKLEKEILSLMNDLIKNDDIKKIKKGIKQFFKEKYNI